MQQSLPLPRRDTCAFRAQRNVLRVTALAALLFLLVGASPAQAQTAQQYLYVDTTSSPGMPTIDGFSKNASTGALSPIPGSPFPERIGGGAMAVDVKQRFLFVANPSANNISMFQIDSSSGALTEVPNSPFATAFPTGTVATTDAVAMAVEPSGQFLFVAYQNGSVAGEGALEMFTIDPANLTLVPNSSLDQDTTGATPFALASDIHGGTLYVGVKGQAGANDGTLSGIWVYSISSSDGSLGLETANDTGEIGRLMAMDPQSRFIYLGDGYLEGFIDGFTLSPVDGSVTGQLPRTVYSTGEYPSAMVIESSGNYLYAQTGLGQYAYSINQTSGDLTQIQVDATPQAIPDPEGPYLYSQSGEEVVATQINLTTGQGSAVAGSPFALSGTAGTGIAISGLPPGEAISGPFPQFDTNEITLAGAVTVGMSADMSSDRMVNNGQEALLITSFTFSGANPGDFSQTNDCPVSLAPAAYCTITPVFTPLAAGTRQASLNVNDNGPGGKQSIALTATGLAAPPPAPEVTFIPSSVTFTPAIAAGATSAATPISVMSSGTSPLTISAAVLSGSNPGDFKLTNNCGAITLPVNSSCSLSVTFAPQAEGLRTATIMVSDNSSDSPQAITLSGSASAPLISFTPSGSNPSTATVMAGQTAQYGLQLAPAAGFTGVVQFQCTGAPQGAACMVSPASTQVTNGTPSAIPVAVTVTTTAAVGSLATPGRAPGSGWPSRGPWPMLGALAAMGVLLAMARRMARGRIIFATAVLAGFAIAGCGGSGGSSSSTLTQPANNSTPAGTYTLTVTANWNGVSLPDNLTLTVH